MKSLKVKNSWFDIAGLWNIHWINNKPYAYTNITTKECEMYNEDGKIIARLKFQ